MILISDVALKVENVTYDYQLKEDNFQLNQIKLRQICASIKDTPEDIFNIEAIDYEDNDTKSDDDDDFDNYEFNKEKDI